MKDNALIPKHVDEKHPSVHPEREEIGMVIPLIQMMADILKNENGENLKLIKLHPYAKRIYKHNVGFLEINWFRSV